MPESQAIRRIPVTVGGRRYVVTTDRDDEAVREMAELVDAKIAEAGGKTSAGGVNSLLIAAMCLADELIEERDRYRQLKNKIRQGSKSLLTRIDPSRFESAREPDLFQDLQ